MHYIHDTSGITEHSVHEMIRVRAFQLYEARDRRPDHALDDWLEAEREVRHHLGLEARGNGPAQTLGQSPAMTKRAFIIHGDQSNPQEAWLPWVKAQLEKRGYVVALPKMPDPNFPVISDWIDSIAKLVGEPDNQTVMIGHSLGCQAILRYLETVGAAGKSVAKTVLVAGIFPTERSLAEAERETEGDAALVPWFVTGLDPVKVRRAAGQCTVILSHDDPYIPVKQATATFRVTLEPHIILETGKGHFNEDDHVTELPSALNAVIS